MAKITTDGNFPKRIGNYILYQLEGETIIRAKSGFTTEALKQSPKYDKSRKNASEFGRISSRCKDIRMALVGVLPKKNNLLVVNSFTKKMREVMAFDTVSIRGERHLAMALEVLEARQLLDGYLFNPATVLQLDCKELAAGWQLTLGAVPFVDGANCIGFRVHQLEIDLANGTTQLTSSDWAFYTELVLPTSVLVPKLDETKTAGFCFTLLEAQFFICDAGSYTPLNNDTTKNVLVLKTSIGLVKGK